MSTDRRNFALSSTGDINIAPTLRMASANDITFIHESERVLVKMKIGKKKRKKDEINK